MADFIFPTAAEIQAVAQVKIPRLTAERLIFRYLPMVTVDAALLMWEQKDNYTGLQQARGLNGQPQRVKNTGAKSYMVQPGVYGEFMEIDEEQLTLRRQYGTFGQSIDIEDLVMERQDQLLGRRLDLIEKIGWDTLQGSYSVANGNVVLASDQYTVQTYDASNWQNPATATPLHDFRQVQLKGRGTSANFGAAAEGAMNRVTFNGMIANTNEADLYGKRTDGLSNVLSLAQVTSLMAGEGLPTIVIYDEGYQDDTDTFVAYIPDWKVIVIGKRPAGQTIGDYAMTRNVNNPGMAAGAYMRVIDHGDKKIPRTIEVHDGHNGGPRVYFPGAIVIMSVGA